VLALLRRIGRQLKKGEAGCSDNAEAATNDEFPRARPANRTPRASRKPQPENQRLFTLWAENTCAGPGHQHVPGMVHLGTAAETDPVRDRDFGAIPGCAHLGGAQLGPRRCSSGVALPPVKHDIATQSVLVRSSAKYASSKFSYRDIEAG
jgi:hypothetical protein